MNLDNLRRFLVGSPTRVALTFAFPMWLFFSAMSGFNAGGTMVAGFVSIGGGILFAKAFYKKMGYFAEDIDKNKLELTRKYSRMFKSGELPKTKHEQSEYLKHLNALEAMYDQPVGWQIAGVVALLLVSSAGTFTSRGATVMSAFYIVTAVLMLAGLLYSRRLLEKVHKAKSLMLRQKGLRKSS